MKTLVTLLLLITTYLSCTAQDKGDSLAILNSTQESNSFVQNGWTFFLISVLVLVALFFIQKYAYLLDRKLNIAGRTESTWEGKPWPLFAGLGLGLLWFLYNTFSPNDLSFNLDIQNPVKWIFIVLILAVFVGIIYESIAHFGIKTGLIRSLIYTLIAILCFYAGFITGLFLVTILALVLLVFVFRYFKKLYK